LLLGGDAAAALVVVEEQVDFADVGDGDGLRKSGYSVTLPSLASHSAGATWWTFVVMLVPRRRSAR